MDSKKRHQLDASAVLNVNNLAVVNKDGLLVP